MDKFVVVSDDFKNKIQQIKTEMMEEESNFKKLLQI